MFDFNTHLQFAVHGGADSGVGVAGMVAGLLSFVEGLLQLSLSEMFANLMPGLSALENLHPLVVHFPIALISLFFLLDLVGTLLSKSDWRRAAGWFLYSGVFFSGLTVAAGLIAADSVPHGGDVHEIMENHEHMGIFVLLLATALAGWRWLAKGQINGAANTLYHIFSIILFGLLIFTADLGGLMVYGYGVAVEPVMEINKEAAALHEHGEIVSKDAPLPQEHPTPVPEMQIEAEHHHDHHDHKH